MLPRAWRLSKIDDKIEVILITFAQSQPSNGRGHGTLQLLADRLVTLTDWRAFRMKQYIWR